MDTMPYTLTDEDTATIYDLCTEFFGSMKADAVFFELTHQY